MVRRLGQLVVVVCVLTAAALLSGALSVVSVVSTSMTPTVCPGDRLLLWTVGAGSRAAHGDLVRFREPTAGRSLLKRVVAVTGQTVEVVDGQLVVDGQPRSEAFVDLDAVDGTSFGPVTVGPRSLFVLGDEREHSVDSRDFGDVSRSSVTGIVIRRPGHLCPLDRR